MGVGGLIQIITPYISMVKSNLEEKTKWVNKKRLTPGRRSR